LEFNIPFQHKYGYITDEKTFQEDSNLCALLTPSTLSRVFCPLPNNILSTTLTSMHVANSYHFSNTIDAPQY